MGAEKDHVMFRMLARVDACDRKYSVLLVRTYILRKFNY